MKISIGNGSKVKYKFPYFTLIDLSKIRLLNASLISSSTYIEFTTIGCRARLNRYKINDRDWFQESILIQEDHLNCYMTS